MDVYDSVNNAPNAMLRMLPTDDDDDVCNGSSGGVTDDGDDDDDAFPDDFDATALALHRDISATVAAQGRNLIPPSLVTVAAADGSTTLHGALYLPDEDPELA